MEREYLRQALIVALHKFSAAGNLDKLQAWAQSEEPGWSWAVARLRNDDARRCRAAIEWHLARTKGPAKQDLLQAIAMLDRQEAAKVAERSPQGRKVHSTRPMQPELDRAKAIADPDKRIDALIRIVLAPEDKNGQRIDAIGLLVPHNEPLKYPDKKIDEALIALFEPRFAKSIAVADMFDRVCRLLALRGRVEYFDRMLQIVSHEDFDYSREHMLVSLVPLAQRGGAEQRAKLSPEIRRCLKETSEDVTPFVLCIYALDLRQWKPELEKMATAGPEDYEGGQASSRGDNATPVTARSHAAHKIVAIWNEKDPLVRAKLLIAFGFSVSGNGFFSRCQVGDVFQTIQAQLQEAAEQTDGRTRAGTGRFRRLVREGSIAERRHSVRHVRTGRLGQGPRSCRKMTAELRGGPCRRAAEGLTPGRACAQ